MVKLFLTTAMKVEGKNVERFTILRVILAHLRTQSSLLIWNNWNNGTIGTKLEQFGTIGTK
jgi:hypothetical protein